MKKYLYEVIIGVLTLAIGVSSYYLYSNKELKVTAFETKSAKAIDIKDEKNFFQNKLVTHTPQKVDNTKVSQKLSELNSMLAKTQNMLKEYNSKNKGNIIIKNEDVDKLVSLDIQQSDKSLTTPITDLQNSLDTQAKVSDPSSETKDTTETSQSDNLSKDTKLTSSKNSSNSYTTSTASSNSINKTQNTSSPSTTSSTNTQTQNSSTNTTNNAEISSELNTLRTKIDKVKETINQVSSNIN